MAKKHSFKRITIVLVVVAIALIALGLMSRLWKHKARVFIPVMTVALVFGVVDAIKAIGWSVPAVFDSLPGSNMGLGWLLPVVIVLVIAGVLDRVRPVPAQA